MKKTLIEYYQALPKTTSPKTEFVNEVAERCNLNAATVRLWLYGKFEPSKPEYLTVLSELTGIPENELFTQKEKE